LTGQSAEHKYGHPLDGAVAQLGERVVRNDEVRSSILLSSTSGSNFPFDSGRWRSAGRLLEPGGLSIKPPFCRLASPEHQQALMKFRPALTPRPIAIDRLEPQRLEERRLAFQNQQLAARMHNQGAVSMILD
jgi:hypothetical protein